MSGSRTVSNPPPPPVRKKKKVSAPLPPAPVNSTMSSSTSSLLCVKEDISVIRPQSVMSNVSATSVRSHKKRRAPPPPTAPLEVPAPAPTPVIPPDQVPSPAPTPVILPPDEVPAPSPTLVIPPPDQVQPGNTVEDCYAVVNKTPVRDVHNDDNYEVCESAIILSDENDEGDNHVYETVEFKPTKNVEKIESSQVTVIVIDDTEISDQKKKKKVKDGKPKKKKKEIENHEVNVNTKLTEPSVERIIETDIAVAMKEDELVPEERNKIKKVKKKKKREKSDVENVLVSPKKEIINIEEKQVTPTEDLLDEAITVSKVPDLPSFRGAKAAEVHRVNESLDNEVEVSKEEGQELDQIEIENDALVNSDDELVDLFTMTSTRSEQSKTSKSGSQNAVPEKQEPQRDAITMEDRESDDGLEKDSSSQYLEVSDGEEPTDPKDTPKKLSGKEIEELKKMEIRQSMMTASSSNYVILDDEDQSFIKSERLRHELKNLQIGDDDTPARVPKRERRAVELDINIEEEESLPSLNSSRASSVINLVTEDDTARNELDRDFAVREMRKEIDVKIKTVKDEGDNEVEYTAVHQAVVVEPSGDCLPSDHENGSDVIVSNIHDTLIDSNDKKLVSPSQPAEQMTNIHVEVETHEDGASVKSPSPDSGIHEWNDSCSSPVSTEDQSPSGASREVPVLNLEDVEIHTDTFCEPEEASDDVIEKVDFPKTHKLDRVLFSMSSYSDRKPEIEQSGSDLFQTRPDYTVLADKLNTSLAARHKLKQEETNQRRPATNYNQQRNSGTGSATGSNYANLDRPQQQQQTAPGPSHGEQVKQRPVSRAVQDRPAPITDQQTFRSRIIEEFQAKKGVLILGRSHSNSLARGAMNGQTESLRFSSLDRQPRSERQESHYDSPRSLMVSMGVWGDQRRPDTGNTDSQQLSPPQASKQSSTSTGHYHQHQPKQIEIRYKNGQTAEIMEDPRKSVLQGSRTSKGDFENFHGIKEEKIEVLPSRPQLRSYKTPNNNKKQTVVEPVIIAKVCDSPCLSLLYIVTIINSPGPMAGNSAKLIDCSFPTEPLVWCLGVITEFELEFPC